MLEASLLNSEYTLQTFQQPILQKVRKLQPCLSALSSQVPADVVVVVCV